MRLHGRILPRAENHSKKTDAANPWDIMYIVQSLEEFKPVKKQSFSFAFFKK
jgi:hypothetical protein